MRNRLSAHIFMFLQSGIIAILLSKLDLNFLKWCWIVFTIYFALECSKIYSAKLLLENGLIEKQSINIASIEDAKKANIPPEVKKAMIDMLKSVEKSNKINKKLSKSKIDHLL